MNEKFKNIKMDEETNLILRQESKIQNYDAVFEYWITREVSACSVIFCKEESVSSLTASGCSKNPDGKRHELYEGSEKKQYTCKFCGGKSSSLTSLTASGCSKSPTKRHQPAS